MSTILTQHLGTWLRNCRRPMHALLLLHLPGATGQLDGGMLLLPAALRST